MMINKRLIGTVSESKKYVAGNVALQWCSLVANIVMMISVTNLRRLCPAKLEGRDKGDLISVITSDIELLEVFYAHTIKNKFFSVKNANAKFPETVSLQMCTF